MKRAVDSLKLNKAAGPDGLLVDLLCLGEDAVVAIMHFFVSAIRRERKVPQQWKDADIVNTYEKRGD